MFKRLKDKWGIRRNIDIVLILICFSFAGSSVVFIKVYYFEFLGFDAHTPVWLKTVAYLLFIFPAYQFMLLGYGILLGQYRFFMTKEKALFARIRRYFITRR